MGIIVDLTVNVIVGLVVNPASLIVLSCLLLLCAVQQIASQKWQAPECARISRDDFLMVLIELLLLLLLVGR